MEELDDYGKKCFQAGRMAERMEGDRRAERIDKVILHEAGNTYKRILCIQHIYYTSNGIIVEVS